MMIPCGWFLQSEKTRTAESSLNPDPFDLVEGDGVAGAVIELGGPGTFVRGHRLRVFERAAGTVCTDGARKRGDANFA